VLKHDGSGPSGAQRAENRGRHSGRRVCMGARCSGKSMRAPGGGCRTTNQKAAPGRRHRSERQRKKDSAAIREKLMWRGVVFNRWRRFRPLPVGCGGAGPVRVLNARRMLGSFAHDAPIDQPCGRPASPARNGWGGKLAVDSGRSRRRQRPNGW